MKVSAVFFGALASTTMVNGFVTPMQQSKATVVSNMVASPLLPGDGERMVPIPPMASEGKAGDAMIAPDFYWSLLTVLHTPFIYVFHQAMLGDYTVGEYGVVFHLALGAFLASQTNRVRAVFGRDSFELFNLANSGDYLKEKPSNYVKGTVNRWQYKDIVDYAFFPSERFPFIVYFKETATDEDQWRRSGPNLLVNEYWGKFAGNFIDPTRGKVEGSPHFMPALFDVPEFIQQMEKRGIKQGKW